MKYEVYDRIKLKSDYSSFEFMSEGHNGKIPKRIQFTSTPWTNIYNLAFGDIKEDGDLDDLTISNNGDRNKILATIVKVVEAYTERYPDRWIYFEGSTEHRTRLYRMAISIYLDELSVLFEFFAEVKGQNGYVVFNKGLNVKAFLIKRKSLNLIHEK
jgi:hypothetical protein